MWDQRLIGLAHEIAKWSKDPSTKVGAVIIDQHARIVGTGYNGFARGVNDLKERLNDREVKYPLTVHAELNAIFNANKSVEGCSIFVTHFPCAHCASCLAQVGIKRVFTHEPKIEFLARWGKSVELATQVLGEAGIEVIYV